MIVAALLLSSAQAKEPYDHDVSITTSPIHLLIPIVEVTAEFRVDDRVGIAGIGGIGSTLGILIGEVGASGRYYPFGDFDHGMQLGAEAIFVAAGTSPNGTTVLGGGIAAGPFLGYKIAARFGLTFEIQLGAAIVGVGAGGETDVGLGPILNLNLGWSF